ncbi:MAG: hypothetical protein HZA94_01775 [Candidatus Vogelbacteria bacterium]|nr:hypothetical protein [Candidatus Vogelbacteria bacterium]
MSKPNKKPRTFLSIFTTKDEKYFLELFGNMIGIKTPGACKFCGEKAYHTFEESTDDEEGNLVDSEPQRFLCCDGAECLAKALPEIFAKFRALIVKESN